jgi:hypothetical protein
LTRFSATLYAYLDRCCFSFSIKRTTGKGTLSFPVHIQADKILLSTKDIPCTFGTSALIVRLSVDGEMVYQFTASVDQGKKPVFTKNAEFGRIKQDADVLNIESLSQELKVEMPGNKQEIEVKFEVITKGMGQHLSAGIRGRYRRPTGQSHTQGFGHTGHDTLKPSERASWNIPPAHIV